MRLIRTAAATLAIFVLTAHLVAADSRPLAAGIHGALEASPQTRAKCQPVVTATARQYLERQDREQVTVWVFFTDKGVSSQPSFDTQADHRRLTTRAARRRAKMNLDRILFADLPVVTEYIEAIEVLGARHRRSSRWLNAASFEVSLNLLDRLAALPIVAEIRPVAAFTGNPEPLDNKTAHPPDATLTPAALDYGDR